MYNSDGQQKMGRDDDQQGASAETSVFLTKRLCVTFKENSNLVWKTKSGVRNTEDSLWG